MPQIIKYFDATHNSDTVEGKGYTKITGTFRTKDYALSVVRNPKYSKWCGMGVHDLKYADYNVNEHLIKLYDSPDEFWKEYDLVDKKVAALAKLTDEEKKILGLV